MVCGESIVWCTVSLSHGCLVSASCEYGECIVWVYRWFYSESIMWVNDKSIVWVLGECIM